MVTIKQYLEYDLFNGVSAGKIIFLFCASLAAIA